MTWNEVRARRLARVYLTERAPAERMLDVVHDVCGVHAQVQASAELQLAARVDGITQEDVRNALWRDRTLVKAWTLRGTLHLHPANELALWLAAVRATSPAVSELRAWVDPKGTVHPALGPEEIERIRVAVLDVLDGRCLLREELANEVVERVGPKAGGRLLSGFAFFGGAELCHGPPQGNKIRLARPDQWIEGWQDVDADIALSEVIRRYLHAYGPARPADFGSWFGPVDFEGLDLQELDVGGRPAFVLAGDTDFAEPQSSVRLLSEYDVYVMGFREREQLVADNVKEQVAHHGRGRYEGPAGVRFLVVDGIAAGLWERKKRSKRIELTVTPAAKLTRAQRSELDAEARRIGAFYELEPVVTVE